MRTTEEVSLMTENDKAQRGPKEMALNRRDAEAFSKALANPPVPSKELKKAAKAYLQSKANHISKR